MTSASNITSVFNATSLMILVSNLTFIFNLTSVVISNLSIFQANDFYLMKDPDPFEERHPSRIDPECPFGMILKCFFKKEALVTDIFSNYMRDNYFTQKGLSKSSFDLNVAACRVLLGILPGLEIQVLADTDGLIKKLFDWAMDSKEPLQSYATGLLAVAMEIQDIGKVL